MKFKTKRAAQAHRRRHTAAEQAQLYVARANYWKHEVGWRRCWVVKRRIPKPGMLR